VESRPVSAANGWCTSAIKRRRDDSAWTTSGIAPIARPSTITGIEGGIADNLAAASASAEDVGLGKLASTSSTPTTHPRFDQPATVAVPGCHRVETAGHQKHNRPGPRRHAYERLTRPSNDADAI